MQKSAYGIVALGLLIAASTATPSIAEGGPSVSSVLAMRQAQSELKREGLYDGMVDGIAGPKTRHGIIDFQQREGLPETARLNEATRDRIAINALSMESAWSKPGHTVAARQ